MSAAHGLDGHQADSLPGARYRDIAVILASDRLAVQRPRYLDRQIALDDGANRRNCLTPIRGLVADGKRRDLRRD